MWRQRSLPRQPPASRSRRRRLPELYLPDARLADLVIGLLSLIWGTTYFVIREGLNDLPPLTAVSTRFALAALLFVLLAPPMARREGGERPGLKISAVLALCNFSFSYGIIYVCETKLPSGLVSVLWATFPMMLAILSNRFLPSEKLRHSQWLGMVFGFVVGDQFGDRISPQRSQVWELAAALGVAATVVCLIHGVLFALKHIGG